MRQRDHPWTFGDWIITAMGLAFYALVLVVVLPVYLGFILALITNLLGGLL